MRNLRPEICVQNFNLFICFQIKRKWSEWVRKALERPDVEMLPQIATPTFIEKQKQPSSNSLPPYFAYFFLLALIYCLGNIFSR